jgi:hypothetical protein
MLKTIGAVAAGALLWIVLASITDRVMRAEWPQYQAVWSAMAFTLPMMFARLAESTVALVIAAWVTARIAEGSRAAPWALAAVMLAVFIPVHVMIWSRLPIWYHAYFLTSLLVLPPLTARLAR